MGLPRIPPYYRRKGYQRFFVGLLIGFIGGWVFFLINSGSLIEEYILQIKSQQLKINQLDNENELLKEDKVKMNEENQKKLLVEDISIMFTNNNTKDEIDRLERFHLENAIKAELKLVLQKDVESVALNRKLIEQLLQNKEYKVDNKKYRITVTGMDIYTTLWIYVKAIEVN